MKNILFCLFALFLNSIDAYSAPTRSISSGRTLIDFSSSFSETLRINGVQGFIIRPGALFRGDPVFYVSSGEFDLSTARGEIIHRGGIRFARGAAVVEFTNFAIDTSGLLVLTASVKINDAFIGRMPIFNLNLPPLTLPLPNRRLEFNSIGLTLREEAASTINNAFGTIILTNGMTVGSASTRFSFRRSIQRLF